jgi:uncharacterized membrane protein
MTRTVVALYEDMPTAQQAVEELSNNGFDRAQISLVSQDAEGRYTSQTGDGESTGENIAEGVGVGAAVGGIGGLLVGLAALAIPGVGPIIAAGPLASALIGAGVGAATGGLIGALGESGVPPEQAEYYAEGVRRGGALVTAQVPDESVDRAISILDRYDPIDIQRRASEWRSEGWTGFDSDSSLSTANPTDTRSTSSTMSGGATYGDTTSGLGTQTRSNDRTYARRTDDNLDETIPVVEEEVRLREEHVEVERRPVNRAASQADFDAFKEGTIEVTETSEEAVIGKQARVVEEVAIHKDARERTETIHDTVRRTEVEVEQINRADFDTTNYQSYDSGFRRHFQTTFGSSGSTYDQYEPAYHYGYTLASDQQYRGRDWNAVEADARSHWEERNQGTWENFKGAVKHAWNEARAKV